MSRFIALVRLSTVAHRDLIGTRQRFELVERYLARRDIAVETTFLLEDTKHLLVLDAPEAPTRYLNRALSHAWPAPTERPGLARVVHAEPWIRRADPAPPADRPDELSRRRGRRPRPAQRELAVG